MENPLDILELEVLNSVWIRLNVSNPITSGERGAPMMPLSMVN